jgi:hypothetical protein
MHRSKKDRYSITSSSPATTMVSLFSDLEFHDVALWQKQASA